MKGALFDFVADFRKKREWNSDAFSWKSFSKSSFLCGKV